MEPDCDGYIKFKKDSVIVALDNYNNRFNLYENTKHMLSVWRNEVAGIKLESAFFQYGRSLLYDMKEVMIQYNKLLMLDLKLNSITETNVKIFKMYQDAADLITVRCKDLRELSCYVDMKKVCWVPFLSSDNTVDTYDIMNMLSQLLSFNPSYIVVSPFILKRWNLKTLMNPMKSKILTPGIRYDAYRKEKDGHIETLTPEQAYNLGVDYLIMEWK